MSVFRILDMAKESAGPNPADQRDWLACLCATLARSVSPGYMRAATKTEPSEREVQRRKIASVLLTSEEIERSANIVTTTLEK